MQYNKEIEKITEEVLESLAGIQRANPKPFLFTRVMARINRGQVSAWEKLATFISRPVVAFATVILFIFINALVLFSFSDDASPVTQEPVLVAGNDFGLSVTSLYDINPEQNDIVQK